MIIHINRLIIFILNGLICIIIQTTHLSFHLCILLVDYLLNFIFYCLVMISLIKYGLTSSTLYHRFAFSTRLFALSG